MVDLAAETMDPKVDTQESSGRPVKVPGGPPREEDRPTLAQSATHAADLGGLASKHALRVKASDGRTEYHNNRNLTPNLESKHGPRVGELWKRRTWKRRHHQERVRSQWIRMLIPGMVLVRTYKHRTYRILVRHHDYQDLATWQEYPTLTAVTVAIVGRNLCTNGRYLCPESATRFWNLKQLMLVRPTFPVPKLTES